jgi:hypothetical protein
LATTDIKYLCNFSFLSTNANRCIWFYVSKVFNPNIFDSFFSLLRGIAKEQRTRAAIKHKTLSLFCFPEHNCLGLRRPQLRIMGHKRSQPGDTSIMADIKGYKLQWRLCLLRMNNTRFPEIAAYI